MCHPESQACNTMGQSITDIAWAVDTWLIRSFACKLTIEVNLKHTFTPFIFVSSMHASLSMLLHIYIDFISNPVSQKQDWYFCGFFFSGKYFLDVSLYFFTYCYKSFFPEVNALMVLVWATAMWKVKKKGEILNPVSATRIVSDLQVFYIYIYVCEHFTKKLFLYRTDCAIQHLKKENYLHTFFSIYVKITSVNKY